MPHAARLKEARRRATWTEARGDLKDFCDCYGCLPLNHRHVSQRHAPASCLGDVTGSSLPEMKLLILPEKSISDVVFDS